VSDRSPRLRLVLTSPDSEPLPTPLSLPLSRIPHAFLEPYYGNVRNEQLHLRLGFPRHQSWMFAKTQFKYKRVLSLVKEFNYATSHFVFHVMPLVRRSSVSHVLALSGRF
jgi:hypothetical protein